MCRLPMTRALASGFLAPCCARSAIRPGISCSARRISLRPNSACERSFTLKGSRPAAFAASNGWSFSTAVAMHSLLLATLKGSPYRCRASLSGSPCRCVFAFSWLHVSFRRCDEQSRTLRARRRWERHDPDVFEPCFAQHAPDVIVAEPEPHVAHLLPVIVPVVREHVDDQHAAARLEDPRDLGQPTLGLRHVMQHEHQRRRIEPRI